MTVSLPRMTLGRSFLLWLLGVLVVIMVLVSALVLWHERGVLETELSSQARVLARTLAVASVEGGSPEFLAVISMGDLRSGEVRVVGGAVLWQYGPRPGEAAALEASLVRVEERIQVGGSRGTTVDVVLLLSRSRIDGVLAAAAVRLTAALGVALALALVVGLDLVGRVVRPLRSLTDSVRRFRPERPFELDTSRTHSVEVRELTQAFADMAARLADQQRSLAASERRFRDLFASSPTPLLELDLKLAIRGANPAAAAYLGCEPELAVGRTIADCSDDGVAEAVRQALAGAGPEREAVVETGWPLAVGDRAEVELHLRAAPDRETVGYLMAIHDQTDRVRRLGERWRRTFDAMVDGVALVDLEGRITLANQPLGSHLAALAPVLAEQVRHGTPAAWRLHSGERLLDCTLTAPGGLGHSILVARDVTQAVRAEGRLREAEKMRAVGTLASGVAHDFNNLLAAIQLHVRWLEREPAAAAEAAAAIRDLAAEGTEVVRELLLYARRESTPPRTLDLGGLVAEQRGVLSHVMPTGTALRLELASEPTPVVGNPVALRRLLLNLVLNARDAVAAAGGWVAVTVARAGERVTLTVADNGPGIPLEHQHRLFEPFFSSRRHGRGAGLGLAVVYAIVTEHGGEIDVDSDGRTGSRFIVRLPIGRAADLEPAAATEDQDGGDAADRVLLVHDVGREAARIVEGLAAAGLALRHATTLSAAREVAREWSPAAVVSVLELPDGAAAPWLLELGVPVVVLYDPVEGDLPLELAHLAAVSRPPSTQPLLAELGRLGVRREGGELE